MMFDYGKVISKIKPDEGEIMKSRELASKISRFIREKYDLDARLMGSVAKNTFLSGDKDLDIFVLFPLSFSREDLEKKGLEIGKAVFLKFGSGKCIVSYAEHPYTKGMIGEYKVEIVPAYLIKSTKELMSAVDRTPFHTNYVISNLKNHDEVRILKKFLKGIGCYGSDLKTEGFSGYLSELLIMRYGSFENVLKDSAGWKCPEIVDIEGHHSKHEEMKIRRMFPDQPLIVIDPIDESRNVAAVLSLEKLSRFMVAGRNFLKKPQANYFFPAKKKIDAKKIVEALNKKGACIYSVTFEKPEVIEDVLYPQLRKLLANFDNYLKRHDFMIIDSWAFADKECGIGFKAANTEVPKYKMISGPSVFNPIKHQETFIRKHKNVQLKDDRYVTEVKRDCNIIDDCIRLYFCGNAEELRDRGVPSYFAKAVSKGVKVMKDKQVVVIKSEEFFLGAERERIK